MPLKKPASSAARLLLAMLVIMVSIVSVSVATQRSALAASPCALATTPPHQALGTETTAEPTYYVTRTQVCATTPVPDAHACMTLPPGGSLVGIQCTNLDFSIASSGEIDVWAVGTYYCQGSGGLQQCQGMQVSDEFAYKFQDPPTGETNVTGTGSYNCTTTGCPSGSNKAAVSSPHLAQWNTSAFCIEAWDVDLAGNLVQPNSIYIFQSTSNYSSPHVNLCFD
jgi:hypothetical protein